MEIHRTISLSFVLYALAGCGSREFVDQSFPNIADALQRNALSPTGKLPVRLPPSAADIHLRFALHSNDAWVSFIWDGAARGRLDECVLTPITAVSFPGKVPNWWATDLPPYNNDGNYLNSNYDFLSCPDASVFAIKHGENRGYYWRDARLTELATPATNNQQVIREQQQNGRR
jgi:hypothetical protein